MFTSSSWLRKEVRLSYFLMKVKIKRFREGEFRIEEYEVDADERNTVLDVLIKIKEEKDPTLSFRAMCRSSICGTCAVKINGVPKLACNTRVEGDEILIEPLNDRVIKDLVVEHDSIYEKLKSNRVWIIPEEKNKNISPQDIKLIEKARDCILCGICDASCPPLLEGVNFGGPLLFTRLYGVIEDKRNRASGELLKTAANLNIRGCVHCSNCNIYCPKGCMPERWITVLENKLVQKGLLEKKTDDFGFLGF